MFNATVNNILSDLILQPGDFLTNRDPIVHQNINPECKLIEEKTVQVTYDTLSYSISLSESASTITNVLNTPHISKSMPLKDLLKTRHDLIVDLFNDVVGKSDRKFKDAYPIMNDGFDDLSPDVILNTPDYNFILEIGTVDGTDTKRARRMYLEKYWKYYLAIENRLTRVPTIYMIIIVTPNLIYSTFELNDALIRQVSYMYYIGTTIMADINIQRKDITTDSTQFDLLKSLLLHNIDKITTSEDDVINDEVNFHHEQDPDVKYIVGRIQTDMNKIMDECNKNAHLGANAHDKLNYDCISSVRQYYDTDTYKERCRDDYKAVIQVPLFLTGNTHGSNISEQCILSSNILSQEVFHIASMQMRENGSFMAENVTNILVESLKDYSQLPDQPKNDAKYTWHRVNIKKALSNDMVYQCAEKGLWAKGLKSDEYIKNVRTLSKQGFSLNAPTSDITSFLEREYNPSVTPQHVDKTLKLIKRANQISGNPPDYLEVLENLIQTDMFDSLMLLSQIAQELTISLNQCVKTGECIFKRLRDKNCHLLINPVKGDSHIFFFIWLNDTTAEVCNGPFPNMHKTESGIFGGPYSVNRTKLQNWLNIPFIWLNTVIHFAQVNGYKPDKIEESLQDKNVRIMSNLVVLTALEDRPRTEEIMSTMRYVYVEFAKGNDPYNPINLKGKLDGFITILRSRLQVWLVQRCLSGIETMLMNKPRHVPKCDLDHEEEELSGDNWDGFINPYTASEFSTFEQGLDIMYLGYCNNKDTTAKNAKGIDLVRKIISETTNYTACKICENGLCGTPECVEKIYAGIEDPKCPVEEFDPHYWSASFVKQATNLLTNKLDNLIGTNWRAKIEDGILGDLLTSGSSMKMATLSASSRLPPYETKAQKYADKRKFKDHCSKLANKLTKTETGVSHSTTGDLKEYINLIKSLTDAEDKLSSKCIEEVAAFAKNLGIHPMLHLKEIIDEINTKYGGVACRLFPKNQHAGIREIYVLPLKCRILQLFVEICARNINKYCPEETLANPANKTKLIDEFHKRVATSASNKAKKLNEDIEILMRFSSEDKTRWNQRFDVRIFNLILRRLLPRKLAKAVSKILSMWKKKLVLLPQDLLDALLNDEVVYDDEIYKRLHNAFRGIYETKEWKLLMGDGKIHWSYIRVVMGMWQGILHSMSSLLHVLKSMHYKAIFHTYILPTLKTLGALEADINVLVSSDDSLAMLAVLVKKSCSAENKSKIHRLLVAFLMYSRVHCRYFNMCDSRKSVIGSTKVYEYNSMFIVNRTLLNPRFKMVCASLPLTEAESLKKRQEIAASTIKDLIENGVSMIQAHFCQMIQALQSYMTMGCLTSPLFDFWVELIQDAPEPSLGFFLLTNLKVIGLVPFSFNYYQLLNNKTMPVIMTMPFKLKSNLSCELNSDFLITHGTQHKWKKLIEDVCVEDWENTMNATPELYYKSYPETVDELLLMLSMKVSSRGVYESLRAQGKMVAMFQSSVYCLTKPCVSVKSTLVNNESITAKNSMLFVTKAHWNHCEMELHKSTGKYEGPPLSNNKDLLRILFPHYELYDTIISRILTGTANMSLIPCPSYRKRKNAIYLHAFNRELPAEPFIVMKEKWFGKNKLSRSVINHVFEMLKGHFTWLSETIDDTLDKSPFTSHMQLASFLNSLSEKSSKVYPTCKGTRKLNTVEKMLEVMKFNPWPKHLYEIGINKDDDDHEMFIESINHMKSRIDLCLISYEKDIVKDTLIWRELFHAPLVRNDFDRIKKLTPINKLTLLALYEKRIITLAEMNSKLLNLSNGHLTTWVKMQLWNDCKMRWEGFGIIRLRMLNKFYDLILDDDKLICIACKDINGMKLDQEVIRDVLMACSITDHAKIGEVNLRHLMKSLPYELNFSKNFGLSNFGIVQFPCGINACKIAVIDKKFEYEGVENEIRWTVQGKTISLNYKDKSVSRAPVVFRYIANPYGTEIPHERVLNPMTSHDPLDDAMAYWLSGDSMTPVLAARILIKTKLLSDNDRCSEYMLRLKGWMKLSLLERLRIKGILRNEALKTHVLKECAKESCISSQPEGQLNIMIDALAEYAMDISAKMASDVYTGDIMAENIEEELIAPTDIDEFAMNLYQQGFTPIEVCDITDIGDAIAPLSASEVSEMITSSKLASVFSNHPFWDNFIKHYQKNTTLWKSLFSDVPPPEEHQQVHEIIQWLLEIEAKPQETDADPFRLALEEFPSLSHSTQGSHPSSLTGASNDTTTSADNLQRATESNEPSTSSGHTGLHLSNFTIIGDTSQNDESDSD